VKAGISAIFNLTLALNLLAGKRRLEGIGDGLSTAHDLRQELTGLEPLRLAGK
jgi:hypothetical protein